MTNQAKFPVDFNPWLQNCIVAFFACRSLQPANTSIKGCRSRIEGGQSSMAFKPLTASPLKKAARYLSLKGTRDDRKSTITKR
ncbi:MAG: hypothetical protein AAGF33_12060 [Pseudomonadota bacterium]